MTEHASQFPDYTLVFADGKEYSIPPNRLTIGRQADCDLVIPDPLVSRRHADLEVRDGTLYIKDLGSANGTIVNGKPVQGECALGEGDVVELGDTRATVRVETPRVSIALRAISPEEAAQGRVIGLDPPSAGYPAVRESAISGPPPPQTAPEQPPPAAKPLQPAGNRLEQAVVQPQSAAEQSQTPPERPRTTAEPPATAPEQARSVKQPTPQATEPLSGSPSEAAPAHAGTLDSPAIPHPGPMSAAVPPIAAPDAGARLGIRTSQPRAVPGGLAAEVELHGVLDIETADQFREAVAALVQAQVIFFTIALDRVEYIDSSGLGALVGLHREIKPRSGSVELRHPQPAVRSVIELTRLDRVFKIV